MKGGASNLELTRNRTIEQRSLSAGFTLTELLLAIVIMAIIAGIGATNYLTSLRRGNDGKRAADLNTLRNALEMYYLDKAVPYYPNIGCVACDGSGTWEQVSFLGSALSPDFTKGIPSDPKSGQSYYYQATSCTGGVCSCYCLSAKMEIADNGNSAPTGCSHCPDSDGGADTAEDNCNYTLTCP